MQILFQSADIPRYKNCLQRTKRFKLTTGFSLGYASLQVIKIVVIRQIDMKVHSEAHCKNFNSFNFLIHFYSGSISRLLRSI
jgi:hypothetical protein